MFGSGRCGWRGCEWMRKLDLVFTNPVGTVGVLDMCLCFGCVSDTLFIVNKTILNQYIIVKIHPLLDYGLNLLPCPSDAIFNVLSVDLLLVPFVCFCPAGEAHIHNFSHLK